MKISTTFIHKIPLSLSKIQKPKPPQLRIILFLRLTYQYLALSAQSLTETILKPKLGKSFLSMNYLSRETKTKRIFSKLPSIKIINHFSGISCIDKPANMPCAISSQVWSATKMLLSMCPYFLVDFTKNSKVL